MTSRMTAILSLSEVLHSSRTALMYTSYGVISDMDRSSLQKRAWHVHERCHCFAGYPEFQGWLDGKCIWIMHVTDTTSQPAVLRLMARQAAAGATNHAVTGQQQACCP